MGWVEKFKLEITKLETMIIKKTLNKVAPHVPVVGSAYGFVKTCIRVSKASTPGGAVVEGLKGIVIDCSPPHRKYPALCLALAACTTAGCVTGDPNFFVGAFGKSIMDR